MLLGDWAGWECSDTDFQGWDSSPSSPKSGSYLYLLKYTNIIYYIVKIFYEKKNLQTFTKTPRVTEEIFPKALVFENGELVWVATSAHLYL